MTTISVMPSITTAMVLSAFRYLVDAELRKKGGIDALLFREGCQEGYVASISDLFGTTTDAEAERAFNNKETWTHIIQQIINDKLTDWVDVFENLGDINDIDFDAFNAAVNDAVVEFALKNPRKLHNALKYL